MNWDWVEAVLLLLSAVFLVLFIVTLVGSCAVAG